MRSLREPIAVTGAGVCCNLGEERTAVLDLLRQGAPGRFVNEPLAVELDARCTVVGRVVADLSDEALGIDRRAARFMGRASRMALHASRAAIAESGVEPAELAVVVGSGTGDVDAHREIQSKLTRTGSMRRIGPTMIPRVMASTVSANLVNVLGARGPSVTAAAACAGGAWNLALAAMLLDAGHAEVALAGGVEMWDPHFHAGFDAMRAYNPGDNDTPERASRPYAADRAGFIMGEGAGAVILEPLSRAEARGAEVLGLLLGFGMSSDGSGEMVAPDPDGAARAIRQALDHAGLVPDDIDYVNTHATSTPAGDVTEVEALRAVFGRPVPYSSTKGYTGHTISAAGALEAVFTWGMLAGGWMAPARGAEPLDPALEDLPPVRVPTDRSLRFALSNAFGFGGTNVCLALGRP